MLQESRIVRLMKRFGNRCAYCDGLVYVMNGDLWKETPPQRRATVDHALPKSRGGSNDASNLILACSACNAAKDHMTDAEFRSFIVTGKVPVSYIQFLAERIRSTVQKHIPHLMIPVETRSSKEKT